jgi:hypothetical protein
MNGSKKYDIPGRRSFNEDISEAQRILKEAIEQHQVGLDGLQAARFHLLKSFGRIERLAEKIDEAFAGQPFLPDLAPNDPANTRRFNAYLGRHTQVMKLFTRTLDLWMLTCGMKREDNWVPLLILDMQLRAAAKATPPSGGAGAKEPRLSVVPDSAAERNRT